MKTKYWIITGKSESGDEGYPKVFTAEPTEKDLKKYISNMGEKINRNGPGHFGSYVYLKVWEQE